MVQVIEDVFGSWFNPLTKKTEQVHRYTIKNCNNISAQVITYGATITSLMVPDINGQLADVTLGYDDIPGYETMTNPYIGATVGRVCSRVGNGSFVLNGTTIHVTRNFLGKHQLHGGFAGFDKVIWSIKSVHADGVVMQFISPEGHEGYPGVVTATASFSLNDDNCFQFCYEATTTKPTPVNITNHAYFNMAGHNAGKQAMCEHLVMIKAEKFTDMDEETVPNGIILDLKDNPLDLRTMTNVGEGLKSLMPRRGYDHNYILDWNKDAITLQAIAYHPGSGRYMEISSNQPCMHFYTSHNMPDVERGETATIIGKGGAQYSRYGSFCMETHWYPDAMNHPNFPSVILNPGEKYKHVCIFKLGAKKQEQEQEKNDETTQ